MRFAIAILRTSLCLAVLPVLSVFASAVGPSVAQAGVDLSIGRTGAYAPAGPQATALDDAACAERLQVRPDPFAREVQPRRRDAVVGGRGQSPSLIAASSVGPCSSAEFAALGADQRAQAIADSSTDCVAELWQFDADVAAALSATGISAVANLLASETVELSNQAARATNLLFAIQIGFFHRFYESTLEYDEPAVTLARDAVVGVAGHADFMTEDAAMNALRARWIDALDGTDSTHLALAHVTSMLARYVDDPSFAALQDERAVVYSCLFSLYRQIANAGNALGEASPWFTIVEQPLADLVATLALDDAFTSDSEFLVDNALWVLGHFSYLDASTAAYGRQALTSAFDLFDEMSGLWLRTVIALDTFFAATLSGGELLDLEQIRADVSAAALPNEYAFDDGRLILRTAVDYATARQMFDAMKEVESQFFRTTTYLDPVPGDPNDVLTLIVYASPDDYASYQPFLFGLPTNNGGIYIEIDSTFYTYDRTPEQSIYTLEELLRHEYVHYLDARHVIAGMFGDAGSLYDDGRLVWYNEGLAEFLAGSTRSDGVLPRSKLYSNIETDDDWLSVAEIVAASYNGGFKFYRYAGAFFHYMAVVEPNLLTDLFAAVRSNDQGVLDALYAEISSDPDVQAAYEEHLLTMIAAVGSGALAFAEDASTMVTPVVLPVGNVDEILDAIGEVANPETGSLTTSATRYRYTEAIEVALATPSVAGMSGVTALSEAAHVYVDSLLDDLAPEGENFVATVGWFGNVEIGATSATATLVLEGPYRAPTGDVDPPAVPAGVAAVDGPGSVALSWEANTDDDLWGYVVYRAENIVGPYFPMVSAPLLTAEYLDTDVVATVEAYHYMVTALDASGNESDPSVVVSAASSTSVLLLHGGYAQDYLFEFNVYAAALDDLGIGYDVWDPFVDGEPSQELIGGYADGLIIWSASYVNTAALPGQLGPGRVAFMQDYLDAGGTLLLTGSYTAGALEGTSLFTDYVGITDLGHGVDFPQIVGADGDVIGDGLDLTLLPDRGGYVSEIALSSPGNAAFHYDPTSGDDTLTGNGVVGVTGSEVHRLVYLALPLDALTASSRTALVDRVVEWAHAERPEPDDEPALMMGDADGDGSVTASDALIILVASVSAGQCTPCACDANGDLLITATDALAVLQYAVGLLTELGSPVGCAASP